MKLHVIADYWFSSQQLWTCWSHQGHRQALSASDLLRTGGADFGHCCQRAGGKQHWCGGHQHWWVLMHTVRYWSFPFAGEVLSVVVATVVMLSRQLLFVKVACFTCFTIMYNREYWFSLKYGQNSNIMFWVQYPLKPRTAMVATIFFHSVISRSQKILFRYHKITACFPVITG